MKTCPQCSRTIEDSALVCGHCGHEPSRLAPAAASSPQQGTSAESDVPRTVPPASRGVGLNNAQLISILMLALILVAAAGALLTGLRTQRQDSSATVERSETRRDSSGLGEVRAVRPEAEAPSASKWSGSRQPGWASDGSRTISFSLQAENEVRVWMKSVRPVLAVRCLAGNTEVFVITNWAASIEPTAELHTVHLSFDDGPAVAEQWWDSDDAQALFAPEGVAAARQIARSRVMRFGFTPFNAAPVTAHFKVAGFDQLVGSVAKTCRWKP